VNFYLRKSLKVGPLRFNLSKSGIGVSGGVRGFRLGTGPRGNYVHMGLHGLYYRKTLSDSSHAGKVPLTMNTVRKPTPPTKKVDELQEIESGDVSRMVDSSSEDLLQELNDKYKKSRLSPVVIVGAILVLLALWGAEAPAWTLVLAAVTAVVGVYFARLRDELAKTVVLFYDFDKEMEKAYEALHAQASTLASCAKVWHIEARGEVSDRKYHAGASELLQRKPTVIRRTEPPHVKTNISTVAIEVGRQTLHFFPDRVLIFDRDHVGAVGYKDLQIEVGAARFIEEEGVPSDAKIVDQTWKYLNKRGGPDKRFKDNRQLPVCLYDQIDFKSSTGMNERIQVSRCDTGKGFAEAIAGLAGVIP
jgi:hypothetical protein